MEEFAISGIVFLLAAGGLLAGLRLARVVPVAHLVSEARSAAQIGIGMVATLAALVLGLMITSAKQSFDDRTSEIVSAAASLVLLDRALANYGAEAQPVRDRVRALHQSMAVLVTRSGDVTAEEFRTPLANLAAHGELQAAILALGPANDSQRWFQQRALALSADLGHVRVLSVERGDHSVPKTLIVILTTWVTLIFVGLGVFAVSNRTVTIALIFCAFAFACSMFLILELDTPYSGFIGVSSRPFQNAETVIGK